jgi:hypothetical protein
MIVEKDHISMVVDTIIEDHNSTVFAVKKAFNSS